MSLTPEWRTRIDGFRRELKNCIYRPLGTIKLQVYVTKESFTQDEASKKRFHPVSVGTKWGESWDYGWFKGCVLIPREAEGRKIVLRVSTVNTLPHKNIIRERL